MDKKQLHHEWRIIRPVKPWYFLVAAIVFGVISIAALRENNLHMVALRSDVYAADKDNGDVETALQKMRGYVYAHMNTDLASGPNAVHPPIQLKYTYDRLVAARSKQASATNSQIYTNAQNYCQAKIPTGFSGRYRLDCIKSYVDSHGAKAQAVPKNLYEFDFVSPKWSPDLAGWSLVLTVFFAVLFAGFWLVDRLIARQLKRHA